MNPISNGSQTPKWCWQKPQLPSQPWPGGGKDGGMSVVTRGGGSSLAPPQKGAEVQPEGDACGAQPTGGRRGGPGGSGQRGFRASGRRPRLDPSHLPLIAARQGEGEGCPCAARKSPPAPGVTSAGPGPGPKASNSRTNPPLPKPAPRGPWGPRFPSAPHHRDNRPSQEAARSQQHPHSHPSHDLKRKKWCRGPQPHFLSLGSGVLRLPSTSGPPQPPAQARSLQSVLTRTPPAL